jgi:hypothetical protein
VHYTRCSVMHSRNLPLWAVLDGAVPENGRYCRTRRRGAGKPAATAVLDGGWPSSTRYAPCLTAAVQKRRLWVVKDGVRPSIRAAEAALTAPQRRVMGAVAWADAGKVAGNSVLDSTVRPRLCCGRCYTASGQKAPRQVVLDGR